MSIDRQKALDDLLNKLRADTRETSDIDLIFEYLQKFLNDPSINKGGSEKLLEFEVRQDNKTLSTIYTVSWRRGLNELL